MKAGSPLSATLRRPPRDAVRTNAAPALAREGESLQKDKWILCAESLQLERKGRPKPRFSPLSTRPLTSLRQEIFVFAARKKFLSAKKSRFWRTKKGIRGREMLHTGISRPRILTFAVFPAASRPSRARRKRAEKFLFDSGNQEAPEITTAPVYSIFLRDRSSQYHTM